MIDPARILIVDHDSGSRNQIREVMSSFPYSLEEASDGIEGLQKVIRFRPDLVLAATDMPRMDGLHMCRQLRMIRSMQEIPIILLAAEQKDLCTLEGLQSGADDLITKPVEGLDLLARVERQLELQDRFARLNSEREGLYLIQEMIHSLYAKKSVHDLLFTLVLNVAEIMEVERCSFVRIQEDRRKGIVEASSDNPDLRNLQIDLEKYPEIIEVFNSRETLMIPDIGKAPIMDSVRHYLKDMVYRSLILIPVVSEDEIIGTLLLRSARSSGPFTEREVWFLETLAAAARPVIEHARIHKEGAQNLYALQEADQVSGETVLEATLDDTDSAKEMMEEVFRIKGGIDRLKQLRKKLRHQGISKLPKNRSE